MPKKLITISVILGIILLGLVGYYFIMSSNNPDSPGIVQGFKNFFPFGGNTVVPTSTSTPAADPIPSPTPEVVDFNVKLRKISSEAVSGAGTLDTKAGTVLRYVEKATGHIFEVELFSPIQNRISNTTIPLVYDAVWLNKNSSFVARYLKDDNVTVDTYSITVKTLTQTGTTTSYEGSVSGVLFPGSISDVSVNGSSIFYLVQGQTSSTGFTSNFDGTKKKQIWTSPIRELIPQYINAKTVTLTTKPAANIPGFLYFVDTGTGAVKKVLGNLVGLSTLTDPLGTQVIYMENSGGAQTSLFDIKTNTAKPLSPTTFPEKCIWSNKDKTIVYCAVPEETLNGDSLTSWYQGFSSFTDDIWKFDLKNNTSSIIENLSSSGEKIDVIKPVLSENEQYLVFINKIDNSLWSLDLTK